jgi:hypothetical protein
MRPSPPLLSPALLPGTNLPRRSRAECTVLFLVILLALLVLRFL